MEERGDISLVRIGHDTNNSQMNSQMFNYTCVSHGPHEARHVPAHVPSKSGEREGE